MIYVFTGKGKGKTTAALGIVIRALGHGQKVAIVQFMKGRKDCGEHLFLKKKIPQVLFLRFGTPFLVNHQEPSPKDIQLAEEGWQKVEKLFKQKWDVVILDEIITAINYKLLKLPQILAKIKKEGKRTHLVLTGRNAPKELIEVADLVTEMKETKHPFGKGVLAVKGLDY